MKRILITGSAGFVAGHFLDLLEQKKEHYDVFGIDMIAPRFIKNEGRGNVRFRQEIMDLMDGARLNRVVSGFQPDYVLHLAALSSVAYSWKHPEETFLNNSTVYMNLIRSVRDLQYPCRILSVGSSEEYGCVGEEALPVDEKCFLRPNNPYAVTKVTQEQISKMYVEEYHMDIVMTRSFNHIGPRQDKRFVVPSFIDRIKRIKESGNPQGEIETGNLEIIRDFVDVRDVVKAYDLLLERGVTGEVYNICSGKGIRLSDLVEMIANELGIKIFTRVNPEFIRPNDIPCIVGNPEKIQNELEWKAEITCEQTIRDMIYTTLQ